MRNHFLLFVLFNLFLIQTINSQDYKKGFYKKQQTSNALAQAYIDSLIFNNSPNSKAFALSAKAYLLIKEKSYSQIDSLFSLAFKELDKISNNKLYKEEKLNVLNFYCLYLLTKHRTTEANDKIYEGLNIANESNNIEMQIKFQNLQARGYNLIGLREEAFKITNKIILDIKLAEHKLDELFFETNLTYTYLNGANRALSLFILDSIKYKKYVDTSKVYLKNANKFINSYDVKLNTEQKIQMSILNGAVKFYKKNYKEAILHYNISLKIASENSIEKKVFQIKYKLAESYFFLKNYTKSKQLFDELSKDNLNQYRLLINKIRINYFYAIIYKELGNIDKSLRYTEIFNEELKTYYKEISDEKLSVFISNELKSKNKMIDRLNFANQKIRRTDDFIKYGIIAIMLIVVLVIVYIKRQKRIFDSKISKLITHIKSIEKEQLSNTTVTIEEKKAKIILTKLKKIEKQELFKAQSYSLNKVAKKIGSNSTYVSQAINMYWNKSFVDYTNELRINFILLKLKNDSIYQKFTLEAIAKSVGYKSLRSFNKHFKSQTGLFPKQYMDLLKNNKINIS